MVIYFNAGYEACAFEVENPTATVDDATWDVHSAFRRGTTWDIRDGQFIELKNVDEICRESENLDQIATCKQNLAKTDYQAIKFSEGEMTEQEFAPIREQRRQWRAEINRLEAENGIQN